MCYISSIIKPIEIMNYTWDKNFKDSSDENFNIYEKIIWNKIAFTTNIKSFLFKIKMLFIEKKDIANNNFFLVKQELRKQILPIVVKIIIIKLIIKGKSDIEVKKSPYSESTYITYMYDGFSKNYIKIRVSMHLNINSKSDISVLI